MFDIILASLLLMEELEEEEGDSGGGEGDWLLLLLVVVGVRDAMVDWILFDCRVVQAMLWFDRLMLICGGTDDGDGLGFRTLGRCGAE